MHNCTFHDQMSIILSCFLLKSRIGLVLSSLFGQCRNGHGFLPLNFSDRFMNIHRSVLFGIGLDGIKD